MIEIKKYMLMTPKELYESRDTLESFTSEDLKRIANAKFMYNKKLFKAMFVEGYINYPKIAKAFLF